MIDVIPDRYKLLAGAVAIACALSVAALAGWQVKSWKANAEIADLKAGHAAEREKQATGALASLKGDADLIHRAATEYATIETTLAPKIAALTKELRHAPKLPADCVPDAYRVRNLDAAIDTANQSIPR